MLGASSAVHILRLVHANTIDQSTLQVPQSGNISRNQLRNGRFLASIRYITPSISPY
jgi:hypothetical protein